MYIRRYIRHPLHRQYNVHTHTTAYPRNTNSVMKLKPWPQEADSEPPIQNQEARTANSEPWPQESRGQNREFRSMNSIPRIQNSDRGNREERTMVEGTVRLEL